VSATSHRKQCKHETYNKDQIGGTITSIGRYVHRYNLPTRVVGADSEFSLLYDYVKSGAFTSEKEGGHSQWNGPGVAGIGFGYQHEAIHFGT